jgi:hypothetical protein
MHTISAQQGHVALRGRVRPHFPVHRGGYDQGHAVDGARKAQQAEQLIGSAMQ